VNFLDLSNNATFDKQVLPRGEPGKLAWGIKRYLSLKESLLQRIAEIDRYYNVIGPDRYYELLTLTLPVGRHFIKGLGKSPADRVEMNEDLRRRVCRYFHISVREIPTFIEIWNNRGKSLQDLLDLFGYNSDGKTVAKRKKSTKKKVAKKSKPVCE
jgi:hypothetical protein